MREATSARAAGVFWATVVGTGACHEASAVDAHAVGTWRDTGTRLGASAIGPCGFTLAGSAMNGGGTKGADGLGSYWSDNTSAACGIAMFPVGASVKRITARNTAAW